ncbi:hypothetical protein DPMN_015908 [Dreissena polymorpha]|uniref:Uncharacterized protein n=1 Tax=Dreissena polymorpha TaxID=45954 RepID=A0A9D4NA32_DREPO|nr:hypothetical protein DPMN_015908 [Dreissena polymorpha]
MTTKPQKNITGAVYKAKAITYGRSQTVTLIGGANAMCNQVPPFLSFSASECYLNYCKVLPLELQVLFPKRVGQTLISSAST